MPAKTPPSCMAVLRPCRLHEPGFSRPPDLWNQFPHVFRTKVFLKDAVPLEDAVLTRSAVSIPWISPETLSYT
jgi:hypothetical protein